MTGALHLGHALNNTLQDILIRMKRMQGFNALWMPGTDHAGIATQAVVERRLREEEELDAARPRPREAGRAHLGVEGASTKPASSASSSRWAAVATGSARGSRSTTICARAVRQTFFDLFKQGLIYRGKRLVNWDTFLQTAVSDDEVFHETVKGHFWHFRYPVIDPQPGEPTHVTIATTRPETMLGDTAVAVHPDPAAALDKRRSGAAGRSWPRRRQRKRPTIQKQLDNVRRAPHDDAAAAGASCATWPAPAAS